MLGICVGESPPAWVPICIIWANASGVMSAMIWVRLPDIPACALRSTASRAVAGWVISADVLQVVDLPLAAAVDPLAPDLARAGADVAYFGFVVAQVIHVVRSGGDRVGGQGHHLRHRIGREIAHQVGHVSGYHVLRVPRLGLLQVCHALVPPVFPAGKPGPQDTGRIMNAATAALALP